MNPKESVLRLQESDYCIGAAATLIHPYFIITCKHLFRSDDVPAVFLEAQKGKVLPGRITHHPFPYLDLVILELAQPVVYIRPIKFAEQIKEDEIHHVLGFPRYHSGNFCATPVSITREKEEKNRHTYVFCMHRPTDIYAMAGSSGGSVINTRGELIAMQQSTDLQPNQQEFYGSGVTSEIIYNMFMSVKGKEK